MAENLIVYQASAGSGKTFMLTREYLLLLFKSPRAFQRILAVTFTNKASGEMKSRILKELHVLATGKASDHLEVIKIHYSKDESWVREQARLVLLQILHNFTRFHVGTIDRFFQRVIRSFAREIGITPSFTIELDTSEILNRAVDEVFYSIDENTELQKWLVSFALEKVEQGSNWQIDQDLINLGKEIFKEAFKTFEAELLTSLNDQNKLSEYKKSIYQTIQNYISTTEQLAKKANACFTKEGFTLDDFSYKSAGAYGNLLQLCGDGSGIIKNRLVSAIDDPDKWLNKSSKLKPALLTCLQSGAQDALDELRQHFEQNFNLHESATAIAAHLPTLGVVGEIHKELYKLVRDQNLFLISDAGIFLSKIIGDNDAPFVYEKSGNIYQHFMIDEFQDTSQLQWNSFKPLILNSLASGKRNVIVGDVKQSIYRWRNSDYTILASGISTAFANYEPEFKALQNNYRSTKNIIAFNNSFFQIAHKILASDLKINSDEASVFTERILSAYRNLHQAEGISRDIEGHVSVKFSGEEEDEEDFSCNAVNYLIEQIENLQENGIAPGEIIMLVRKASEGTAILNSLLQYKNSADAKPGITYTAISGESLKLDSSSSIRFILYFFTYLSFPEDALNNASLLHEYLHHIAPARKNDESEISNPLGKEIPDLLNADAVASMLRLDSFPAKWKKLSLIELSEKITGTFELGKNTAAIPYLQAFQDVILEFTIKYALGSNDFLEWWEHTGSKKAVPEAEAVDAMRIMTIHKAKGLQARAILIPFCNWDIDHHPLHTNLLWCKPEKEPFNTLPLVPVKYGKKLTDTIFNTSYLEEKTNAFLDNLNLLYVAFTRAEEYLMIYCPESKGKEIKNVADLIFFALQANLSETAEKEFPLLNLPQYFHDNTFTAGEIDQVKPKSTPVPDTSNLLINEYQTHDFHDRLQFRPGRFSDELYAQPDQLNILDTGTLLHKAFENIGTAGDVEEAVTKLIFEGLISMQDKEEYIEKINKFLSQTHDYEWFTGKHPSRSEAAILLQNGTFIRPDRVMFKPEQTVVIDFKFGLQREDKHHVQVLNYMNKIKNIENKAVEGFLWYPELNMIVAVHEQNSIQQKLF